MLVFTGDLVVSDEGFHEHRDRRGVLLRMWTLDLLDGDIHAALLYNQLLWWHQPGLDGTAKAKYERDGQMWLLRTDDDWYDECRMTQKQVRRVRSVLVTKGLIEHRRFKLNGAPTSAWRPVYEAIRPDPELPSEGQFQGSDPGGAVPIPLARELDGREQPPKVSRPRRRATVFPDPGQFLLTDAMKGWASKDAPNVDIVLQTKQFADYYRGKGEKRVDWVATWRTWMRNAEQWNHSNRNGAPPPEPDNVPDNLRTFVNREEYEAWKATQK